MSKRLGFLKRKSFIDQCSFLHGKPEVDLMGCCHYNFKVSSKEIANAANSKVSLVYKVETVIIEIYLYEHTK